MNATATTATQMQFQMGHTALIYLKEAKYELLKALRLRIYTASLLGFPLMFYVLFGLLLNTREAAIGGTTVPAYMIASYGTFGVMGASLFGTAAGLASERGLGWLQLKRASPMPPSAYFLAKLATSAFFSTLIVLLLMLLGALFGGVHLGFWIGFKMLATLVAGSLPFGAMGLAIGYFAGPNSAASVVNLIYLPLSFCSGLWVPYMFLPKFIRQLAHVLPSYHLSQLGLSVIGAGQHEPVSTHLEYMLAFTLICLGAARIGFQRDQGKSYG
jgi:ABC-2 type transport system permease protein